MFLRNLILKFLLETNDKKVAEQINKVSDYVEPITYPLSIYY